MTDKKAAWKATGVLVASVLVIASWFLHPMVFPIMFAMLVLGVIVAIVWAVSYELFKERHERQDRQSQ